MKSTASLRVRLSTAKPGFTLTELLVVIAIVAVLASISVSIVRSATANAERAGCAGIMRQIGIATTSYFAENNGAMPGPSGGNGQNPQYRKKSDWNIFSQLIPYLGLEEKSTYTALPDSLVCPSFRRRYRGWNADGTGGAAGNVYRMNQDQMIRGQRVWGPQGSEPQTYGAMKYNLVADGTEVTPASKIIYLADGCVNELTNPVHGNHRNFLFLDLHVETLPPTIEANPSK